MPLPSGGGLGKHFPADVGMTTNRKVSQRPRLYYGWVVVGVVALVGFAQSADTLPVLSVFLKPITEDFGWSRSVFTGAITIGTFLGGLLALGVGPFLDRFGGRWSLVVAFAILGGTLVLLAARWSSWRRSTGCGSSMFF